MDENDIFDPSLKKKKKKKKTPFDLDAAMGEEGTAEEKADEPTEKSDKSEVDVDALTADGGLDLGLKKKKKKKQTFNFDEFSDNLPSTDAGADDNEKPSATDYTGDLDFSNLGKKKKKKKVALEAGGEAVEEEEQTKMEDNITEKDSDRDYTYDELLKRVFDIMREKNPEMVSGEKKRFVMKPPQVMRAGAKKVAFTNFSDICKMLHRQPKHFMAFLLAELGTSGSIDGSNQLIIKGKFQQKQVENVLRHYIKEYVTCHTCKSPETILQRDTRLYFLQCETCGSRCSVASIKSGFQAVTGKRAAMRAKTN